MRATDGRCDCMPAAALAARWKRRVMSSTAATLMRYPQRNAPQQQRCSSGGELAGHLHPSALLRASHIGC